MIRPQVKVRVLNAPTPSAPPSQVPLPPVDPSSLQRLPLCQPGHLCHLRTSVSLTGLLKNTFAQSCAKLAAPLEQLLVMSSLRTRCHASGLLGAGALHLNKKPLEREQNASNILLWHNNWAIPGTGEQLWQQESSLTRETYFSVQAIPRLGYGWISATDL